MPHSSLFNTRSLVATVLVTSVIFGVAMKARTDETNAKAEPMKERVFELRTYITHPGRMPAMHARFRDHTNGLFEKHGMELVGYWNPLPGPEAKDAEVAENTLIYILAYPSLEAREKSWKDFLGDPEWKKVSEESQKDGLIVKSVEFKFLKPTDYSPIK